MIKHLLAQTPRTYDLGTLQGTGPGQQFINPTGNPANRFAGFVTAVIGLLTIVAAVWFIFLLVTGGITIVTSSGDKGALESARKKITTGIIGLSVVVVGLFLVDFVASQLLGIQVLNIAQLFNSIF